MYGALYLMVPGIYATSPVSCAWVANNSEPYFRRGSAIAIAFMATSCVRPSFLPGSLATRS